RGGEQEDVSADYLRDSSRDDLLHARWNDSDNKLDQIRCLLCPLRSNDGQSKGIRERLHPECGSYRSVRVIHSDTNAGSNNDAYADTNPHGTRYTAADSHAHRDTNGNTDRHTYSESERKSDRLYRAVEIAECNNTWKRNGNPETRRRRTISHRGIQLLK